jgi:DNA polymerase-1
MGRLPLKRPDILLIDADTPAYTACQASEVEVEYGDWHMVSSNFPQALHTFQRTIDLWIEHFQCDNVELFFTGRNNFRKDVDPDYKGHRNKRKPLGFYRLVKWALEHPKSHLQEGLEADDLLGLRCHLTEQNVVLISADKDLRQISCRQWNGSEEVHPTPLECDRFFFQQVLTGDPVDGYKGCPGIGAVKAKAILDKAPPELWWEAVVAAYVKAGLTEADALQNARLARILRPGEYNWKDRSPILWTPST